MSYHVVAGWLSTAIVTTGLNNVGGLIVSYWEMKSVLETLRLVVSSYHISPIKLSILFHLLLSSGGGSSQWAWQCHPIPQLARLPFSGLLASLLMLDECKTLVTWEDSFRRDEMKSSRSRQNSCHNSCNQLSATVWQFSNSIWHILSTAGIKSTLSQESDKCETRWRDKGTQLWRKYSTSSSSIDVVLV